MLTELYDSKGGEKCAVYWPTVGKTFQFDGLMVKTSVEKELEECPGIIFRKINIKPTDGSKAFVTY